MLFSSQKETAIPEVNGPDLQPCQNVEPLPNNTFSQVPHLWLTSFSTLLIVLFGGFIEKESRALRVGKYRIVLAKKDVAILTVSFLERLQGEPTEARPKGVLAK